MGRMEFAVDNDLEDLFRSAVARRLGYKRGNLSIAIEQAIRAWLNESNQSESKSQG